MIKMRLGRQGASGASGSVECRTISAICRRLLRDESGQDLIEYALVAALVGLGAVASIRSLGTTIGTAFSDVGDKLTTNV